MWNRLHGWPSARTFLSHFSGSSLCWLNRLDLIKNDTDGHELQMLEGSRKTIEKYKPYVIFEVGLYIIEEYDITLEQYFNYFSSFGYTLLNNKSGKK